jgi:hypothetical protein
LQVINAYTLLDDVTSLADKVQSFFAQNVVTETHDVLKNLLFQVPPLSVCRHHFKPTGKIFRRISG